MLSPEEGDRIGKILLSALSGHKNGVGLAANQIGINKRVCVVNVNKPIVLVNPKIAGHFGKFFHITSMTVSKKVGIILQ